MSTLVIESKPRQSSSGNSWRIDVFGPDDRTKDDLKTAIGALEHHPAKAVRRSLIDILALIDQFKLEIKYTEHSEADNEELESWLFIVQG